MAIRVALATIRWTVPTREQPGPERDPQVMRTAAAETGRFLGVYADCEHAGELAVGATVTSTPAAAPTRAQRAGRGATARVVTALQRLIPGA